MLADLSLNVARQIPPEFLWGLATGAYKVHGGVIRDVGGRIVAHLTAASSLTGLVPGLGVISDVIQQAQIGALGKDVRQVQAAIETVLNVSAAGAALSGLGVVTSVAGFAYLSSRFDQVDKKLAVIERNVKDIKDWLTGLQKSKLHSAIDGLRHADTTTDEQVRRGLLIQSKRDFATLTHHYREQWARSLGVLEMSSIDDLYTLAMLGHAAACSNLGLGAEAATDLRGNYDHWVAQARVHTRSMLFADRPERLLAAEYVELLPARDLVTLLDFGHDRHDGIDWIDRLRAGPTKKGSMPDWVPTLPAPSRPLGGGKNTPSELVDAAKTLNARASVLDAAAAHYAFLSTSAISATQFERLLEDARREDGADALCVWRTRI
ncbi:hypothetical protein [Brevundimonas sp.]|uniref:hypothetical protein n=1 Tax=Brevundimonas sp. TaxID=1871086 RepID=UPI002624834A|nr:hypothetical protein [Brevundimonas sp.]